MIIGLSQWCKLAQDYTKVQWASSHTGWRRNAIGSIWNNQEIYRSVKFKLPPYLQLMILTVNMVFVYPVVPGLNHNHVPGFYTLLSSLDWGSSIYLSIIYYLFAYLSSVVFDIAEMKICFKHLIKLTIVTYSSMLETPEIMKTCIRVKSASFNP